jgi:molybdate transport system substrate-binding protein
MPRGLLVAAQLAIVASATLPAEPSSAGDRRIMVLAASSLTETLQSIVKAWTSQGHQEVVFSFDATSRLARQVEAGIPADAFFSADLEWIDTLVRQGLIRAETRVELAGNRLVAVVPVDSALRLSTPLDLARPEVARVAVAGDAVPAGRYARAALARLGFWQSLEPRVVTGDNVRTVLAWVASGEADAGIVYATDARIEPRVRTAFLFAPESHPPIVYPAAVLRDAPQAQVAAEFLNFCMSPEGQALFRAAGFTEAPKP